MDFLSLLLGILATVVALLLGIMGLAGKIKTWFKSIASEALLDAKLIRYPADGIKNWPNGADTLPDAIEHLWESQVAIQNSLNKLCEEGSGA